MFFYDKILYILLCDKWVNTGFLNSGTERMIILKMKNKKIISVVVSAFTFMSGVIYCPAVLAEENDVNTFIPGGIEYKATYIENIDDIFSVSTGYNAALSYDEQTMWKKTSTDYAYRDCALRKNGDGRQKLYTSIDNAMKSFWNSIMNLRGTQINGNQIYVIGKVDYTAYGLTEQDAIETYYMYKNDHPLAYYSSNEIFYTERYLIFSAPEYYKNSSDRKKYNQMINDYIDSYSECYDSSSEYKTVLAFHDRLCSNMEYAFDGEGNPEVSPWAHDIIGAVSLKKGVCESYSRTFEMLLNYYGINNVFCAGESNGGGHAWNMAELDDGQYYFFDLTWDDFLNTSVPDYTYFGKGTAVFELDHTICTPEGAYTEFLYEIPKASLSDFDWETYEQTVTAPPEKNEIIQGDINADQKLSYVDFILMIQYMLNDITFTEEQLKSADMNDNGVLNVFDLVRLKRYILNN